MISVFTRISFLTHRIKNYIYTDSEIGLLFPFDFHKILFCLINKEKYIFSKCVFLSLALEKEKIWPISIYMIRIPF